MAEHISFCKILTFGLTKNLKQKIKSLPLGFEVTANGLTV